MGKQTELYLGGKEPLHNYPSVACGAQKWCRMTIQVHNFDDFVSLQNRLCLLVLCEFLLLYPSSQPGSQTNGKVKYVHDPPRVVMYTKINKKLWHLGDGDGYIIVVIVVKYKLSRHGIMLGMGST